MGWAGNNAAHCNIDPQQVTVGGLSAGAFQAVQMAVAHSGLFAGLGVVAGGPFYCAQNQLDLALTSCTKTPALISDTVLLGEMTYMETTLQIDPLKNIEETNVYLYSGTLDTVVHQGVMSKLEEQLSKWVDASAMTVKFDIPSVHSIVTDYTGHACDHFESPYIVNCGYDLAGEMLTSLYGPLNNRSAPTAPPASSILDNVYQFSQAAFIPGVYTPGELSLDTTAYAYVPPACIASDDDAMNATFCKLLVLFHGCEQSLKEISTQFVLNTGVLQWAETNNIAVLFPQATSNALNPKSCFDWWGYTGVEYPTKLGPQIATVYSMMQHMAKL